MSAISNAYLIVFLPLIASLFTCLFSDKKVSLSIVAITNFLIIALTCQNLLNVLAYKNLSNNFDLGSISLGLEFSNSALGSSLLALVILVKSLTFLFFAKDIDNFLDAKSKKLFYPLYLFQFFALSGIFTSDSFFNIIIFTEIYIFTLFSLSEIFLNQKDKTWRYFLVNSLVTILIFFCLIISQIIFSENSITRIANEILLVSSFKHSFLLVFFLILIFSLLLKVLLPYFCFKSEACKSSDFFLSELYFVKSLVTLFIILKFSYVFFGSFSIELFKKVAPILIFISLSVVTLVAINLKKNISGKAIFANIFANNLATIFIAIAISNFYSLQSLFFLIINFILVNLAFFFIFSLSEEKIDEQGKIFITLKRNYHSFFFPIKVLLFFLAAFPLSFLFFSNWYLVKASFDSIYLPLFLLIIVIANFSYVLTSLKLFETIEIEEEISNTNNLFHIIAFLLLFLLIILLLLFSNFIRDLSLEFAASLIS